MTEENSKDGTENAVVASAGEKATEVEPTRTRTGPATLTDSTEWKFVLSLTGPPVDGVFGSPVEVSCKATFSEEEGYEPPQGAITFSNSNYLGSSKSFWRLDEDPEAQGFDKAGFWIWGLFEEPKYPFILLQLEVTQDIAVAGEGEIIKAGSPLYVQGKVTREEGKGVSISDGLVTVREPVKIQVDLLGLSDGILEEVKPYGTFKCTPL